MANKKTDLFVQANGFLTLANSYRIPDKLKLKVLEAPEGKRKALLVEICETPVLRSSFEEMVMASEDLDENAKLVACSLLEKVLEDDEVNQKVIGRLRIGGMKDGKPVAGRKHNLTSNFTCSFKNIQTVVVEGQEELSEGDISEEMLAALLSK